jgi:peptide/nickel transport system permease protein
MIRRLLLLIPTLLLVSILVFLSVRFIPGSVVEIMAAQMSMSSAGGQPIDVGYLRRQLGLDEPIHLQYWKWLTKAARGDLGNSLWGHQSITQEIVNKAPISIELGIWALITGLIIALPIGIYSAIRQDTLGDYAGRTFAILCISLPGFWLATIAIVYPSIWWGWSPVLRYIPFSKDPVGNIVQFSIPGIIMGASFSGGTMRLMRTMMLEVLRQDYIRTAWSKGLSERVVIMRHALKNAMLPVVTVVGMSLPMLIGGDVIFEQIFALPGIGRYLLDAVGRRDYPIICGINLVIATAVLVSNLGVDLAYGWLDPRVQHQ